MKVLHLPRSLKIMVLYKIEGIKNFYLHLHGEKKNTT
jgi:hypothetical protein